MPPWVQAAQTAANTHPHWKAELERLQPRLARNKAIPDEAGEAFRALGEPTALAGLLVEKHPILSSLKAIREALVGVPHLHYGFSFETQVFRTGNAHQPVMACKEDGLC